MILRITPLKTRAEILKPTRRYHNQKISSNVALLINWKISWKERVITIQELSMIHLSVHNARISKEWTSFWMINVQSYKNSYNSDLKMSGYWVKKFSVSESKNRPVSPRCTRRKYKSMRIVHLDMRTFASSLVE